MVVLVTGGSGFIGRHAVDKLIVEGHSVRILDIISPHRNDVDYFKGSILDSEFVTQAVKDVDIIYHFAGMSNIDKVHRNPIKTLNYNIIGTANILEIIRQTEYIKTGMIMTSDKCYDNTIIV